MERRLPIYQLTPQAASEGSRMIEELLFHDVAAQRAKRTVAAFPSNPADLWAIKMCPEAGYVQLVRIVSIIVSFALLPFLLLILVTFAGTDPQWVHLGPPAP